LRANIVTNTVALPGTLTVGLHPVTASAGTLSNQRITIGAAVAGSTLGFTTPPGSSQQQQVTGDFAFTGAGLYVLGVSNSSALPGAFFATVTGQLQVHNP
jgi:hypothetical protein